MQEESGSVDSVENTVADSVMENEVKESGAETETVVENQPAPKKKASKKKKASIPTVDAVIASETGEALPEEQVEETQVEEAQSEEKVEPKEEADKSAAAEKETTEAGEEKKPQPDEEESELSDEEKAEIEKRRSEMNLDNETALLETVLFLESEPQPVETLSKITQLAPDVVEDCIQRLKDKYANADSGIEISQIIGGWLLTPKKECFDLVKERYGKKNGGRLSKAAIETLSIIAYSQPITRAEIESIRHVSADNMMRVLLDRKFIKEVGKKDIPGKPVTYGTTKEFLEFFHLQSIAELPQLDEKESERFELAR